jgi:MFS family permease
MMTPVARLLLLRTVDKRSLVDAMAWLTIPALVGPLVGPPLGGFITTYFAWHWIFTINLPIGILGIILVTRFIEDVRSDALDPLDLTGIVFAGIAVAGLAFGLSVAGLGILPWQWVTTLLVVGAMAAIAYAYHARRIARPALDFSLLAAPTFRASVTGGSIFRIGVGAIPFLVPLLMQLGFGLSPFQSGLITFAGAAGALTMKALAARILRRYGFRRVLVVNSLLGSAFIAAGALFVPGVPFAFIIVMLLIGGFFRSLQFTSIGTIAYADLTPGQMSRGTTLSSVAQQVSLSAGVALGAFMVDLTLRWRGFSEITAEAFPPAFLVVGAISALSVFAFMRLPPNAGEAMSGRRSDA